MASLHPGLSLPLCPSLGERNSCAKKDLQSLSWFLIRSMLLLGDKLGITAAPRLSDKVDEYSSKPALLALPGHRGPDPKTFVWLWSREL